MLRHIKIKLSKVKERILKIQKRKKKRLHIKWNPLQSSTEFLAEILKAKRDYSDLFKILKEKDLPTKNTMPGKTAL